MAVAVARKILDVQFISITLYFHNMWKNAFCSRLRSFTNPRIANLDTRAAEATNEADRMMIHALIEQMPGGFDAMNTFVRETISDAGSGRKRHFSHFTIVRPRKLGKIFSRSLQVTGHWIANLRMLSKVHM